MQAAPYERRPSLPRHPWRRARWPDWSDHLGNLAGMRDYPITAPTKRCQRWLQSPGATVVVHEFEGRLIFRECYLPNREPISSLGFINPDRMVCVVRSKA